MKCQTQLGEVVDKLLATANETLLEALEISKIESERKSNFLRMVSHELRTPLHSITAAFRQWDHAESAGEQKDILDDINYGTEEYDDAYAVAVVKIRYIRGPVQDLSLLDDECLSTILLKEY